MITRVVCITCFLIVVCNTVAAENQVVIKHYQSHYRYDFGLKLLTIAMEKTNESYTIIPHKLDMNEARGEAMVIKGDLDLEFMSTNHERESNMIPIKIPVYRGLLGLRLLLVKKTNSDLVNITHWNINQLRHFTAGHGRIWKDLPIYEANQLRVISNPTYDGIFQQLIHGRIDYFHRGLAEIWDEYEQYKDVLVIQENVMLFYKHPVYFFITKSRPDLARLIENGLTIALNDGSYKQLFLDYYGDKIKAASLDKRTLILLDNPVIPKDCPPVDTSWWLPEKFQHQLNQLN